MKRFGIFDENNRPMRCGTFDRVTRFEIAKKFEAAWVIANPEDSSGHGAGWCTAFEFIIGLETYADPDYLRHGRTQKESAQRRREKIIAVANAFEALSIAASKVNEHDLLRALEAGFIATLPSPPHPYYHQAIEADACRKAAWDMTWRKFKTGPNGSPTELKRFADGMRQHINAKKLENLTLPTAHDLAIDIVRFLDSHNINATTSSTGLAGFSFEATFELAGLPPPKAGYWISKAKKSFETEKVRENHRQEKAAEKDDEYLASLTPWDRSVELANRQALADWLDDEVRRIDNQLKQPLGLPKK